MFSISKLPTNTGNPAPWSHRDGSFELRTYIGRISWEIVSPLPSRPPQKAHIYGLQMFKQIDPRCLFPFPQSIKDGLSGLVNQRCDLCGFFCHCGHGRGHTWLNPSVLTPAKMFEVSHAMRNHVLGVGANMLEFKNF
jgi:hypothetical protein